MYETVDIADQHRTVRNMHLPEVVRTTGLSRSTIYKLMKRNEFPASHKLRDNCTNVAWYADEVYAYVERDREKTPTRPRKIALDDRVDVSAEARSPSVNGGKLKALLIPKPKLQAQESGLVITTFTVSGHAGEVYIQKGTGKLFGAIGQVPPEVLSLYFAVDFDLETGTN
jgi:predicted DNA-binding transcriptional regulator AlpA